MSPSRREALQLGVLSAVTALAGCSSDRPATATPSGTSMQSAISTPTSSPNRSAVDVLPEPRNGWRLVETERELGASMLGGETGATGKYESATGGVFKVVALEMEEGFSAEDKAHRWACIGWDVTVAYQGFAFSAGTGTHQQTFTPETPPHMTRTPVPDSEDDSIELLTYSPLLSEQIIGDHRQYCSE